MPYKYKLQLLILPLIIIPLLAVTLIFIFNTIDGIKTLQLKAMEFKIKTLKENCKDYDAILKKANIDKIDYYVNNAKSKIMTMASEIDIVGGDIFIIDTLKAQMLYHPKMSNEERKALAGADYINQIVSYKQKPGVSEFDSNTGNWVYLPKDPVRINYKHDSKDMVASFLYFDKWSWAIVAAADKNIVYKPVNDARNISIIVAVIFTILAVVLLFFIATGISKPIQILKENSIKMGEGDLDIDVDIKSKDEFGTLGKFFNDMAHRLRTNFSKIESQKKEIQQYSENLEQLVEERTKELKGALKELKQAFEEITGLKKQQDGDYFLTSLLIKPLMVNYTESKWVKTEFYVSQKKKFTFRKWRSELGGDICISHTIILNDLNGDKEYTVFVNGDAMGKSIQGAGGSLILGVVFNAFVTRTKFVRGAEELSPEQWLIDCYRELQSVFKSFDGSMLISVVMGIIDDETGMMYYFNAEHPWTVLYRRNEAKFIENELLNRKIGNLENDESRMKLKTLQLNDDDIIIAGSDGRDDIMIGKDEETGIRIINEDETMFLECVEEGKGDLNTVVENIRKKGELTDDLSLIKIHYRKDHYSPLKEETIPEEFHRLKKIGTKAYAELEYNEAIDLFEEAIKLYPDSECYSKLINSYIKKEMYPKALFIAEKAIKHFPGHLTIIFQISLLYRKAKEYGKAIYYGRRYYIHNPENIANLINLAESYRAIKDVSSAMNVLREAENIEPNNPNVIKLKKIISKSSKLKNDKK